MNSNNYKGKVFTACELPWHEQVYLKKGYDGWRVVYPPRNEDGSWNYTNLFFGGSIWNLLKNILIITIIVIALLAYNHDVKQCRETMANITDVCASYYKPNQVQPNSLGLVIPSNFMIEVENKSKNATGL